MSVIAHIGDYVIANNRSPRRFAIGSVREVVLFGNERYRGGRWYRIGPENLKEEVFPWIYPNVRHITRAQGKRLIRAYHRKTGTPMFHQIWNHLIAEHHRKNKAGPCDGQEYGGVKKYLLRFSERVE